MSQSQEMIVLHPHYYLDNFTSITDTIAARYTDLLTETERDWLTTFSALPLGAKLLLVRLLSRTGNWFRRDKLSYAEIEDIDAALVALERAKMVSLSHQPPFDVMASLLTKPELLSLFSHLHLKSTLRKPQIVESISATLTPEQTPRLTTPCICVHHDVMPVFLLLYFGNSRQDLSQFVLNDLGIYRFESVTLRQEDRLFTNRDQIENWLKLSELADLYWQYAEAKNRAGILALATSLPPKPDWSPLSRKWERLANHIARDMEREEQLDDAQALYQQSTLPPARERLARIAIKQGAFEDAANYVNDMLGDPFNEDEHDVACRLARQLSKKTAISAPEKSVDQFEQHTITLALNQRVELETAHHYAQLGWRVWYTENCLLNALFGLLYWDIIFAPIPGAFLNPFQRGPRDMYSSEFLVARQRLIEARNAEFMAGNFDLLAIYDAKAGLANDWVNWQWIDRTLLEAALETITPHQLISCLSRLLFDRRANRSGHPDLFMVKGSECQFIEVKGPGDKLQHHQVRWLNFLNGQSIKASVTFVKENTER